MRAQMRMMDRLLDVSIVGITFKYVKNCNDSKYSYPRVEDK